MAAKCDRPSSNQKKKVISRESHLETSQSQAHVGPEGHSKDGSTTCSSK
jgi:hypothetical protein